MHLVHVLKIGPRLFQICHVMNSNNEVLNIRNAVVSMLLYGLRGNKKYENKDCKRKIKLNKFFGFGTAHTNFRV